MQNAPFTFDIKGIIAVLVIIGSFGLVGIYVERGVVPDATIMAFVSLPLGAVIGFYFGHINGAATALAQQTTALAAQALTASVQRRTGDITVSGPVAVTATPVPVTTPIPPVNG